MGQATAETAVAAATAPKTPTEVLHEILSKVEGIAEADLAKLKSEISALLHLSHKEG